MIRTVFGGVSHLLSGNVFIAPLEASAHCTLVLKSFRAVSLFRAAKRVTLRHLQPTPTAWEICRLACQYSFECQGPSRVVRTLRNSFWSGFWHLFMNCMPSWTNSLGASRISDTWSDMLIVVWCMIDVAKRQALVGNDGKSN